MNVVIINCFDTYEYRVDLLYNYFKSRGDSIKVYTSDFRHFKKVVRKEKKEDFIFIKAKPYYKNLSVKRLWSHYNFTKDVFSLLTGEKVDLLWVLIPPNYITKYAAKYKKEHSNVKLVVDVIDMWPETMPIGKLNKMKLLVPWKRIRDKWIVYADHVVTECNLYQKKLNIDRSKITTVYLARKERPFNGVTNLPENKIGLCYLGSINNIIDIDKIGSIIKYFMKIKPVQFHIIGDGEKRDHLIEVAKSYGADIVYHGNVYDREKKQEIFNMCHFGLNIMKSSVLVGLTMKSIDYFEAGLPIINNIHGDTWDFIDKYGIGVNCDAVKGLDKLDISRKDVRHFFEQNFSIKNFECSVSSVIDSIKNKDTSSLSSSK